MEQAIQLGRVSDKIGAYIIEFCQYVVRAKEGRFFMKELQAYVSGIDPTTAPDSPSRILRALRKANVIDYVVTSRADSAYLVRSVCTA